MATNQLFIPSHINVGFRERKGTYTGKLAYIIYWDQKGVLRKEKSWQSWRSKKIESEDFDNEPTSGFVLNKKAGGYSTGWNHRNTYVRIYDPRGFEFEISVANLLFILSETNCSKGKGLEGEFVYSWDGTELVLLPTSSANYASSMEFTSLQDGKIGLRDLEKGATYKTKQQRELTYLGRFAYHHMIYRGYWQKKKFLKGMFQRHVFWNGKNFTFLDSGSSLATKVADTISDYAELVDKYYMSRNGTAIKRVYTKPTEDTNWCYEQDGKYFLCGDRYAGDEFRWTYVYSTLSLEDGILTAKPKNHYMFSEDNKPRYGYTQTDWVDNTGQDLYVELESGAEFSVHKLSKGG